MCQPEIRNATDELAAALDQSTLSRTFYHGNPRVPSCHPSQDDVDVLCFLISPSKQIPACRLVPRISKSSSTNHHFFQAPPLFYPKNSRDKFPKKSLPPSQLQPFFWRNNFASDFFSAVLFVVENFFRVDFFFSGG